MIKVTTGDHTMEMTVQDNGKGFDRDKIRLGNGLQNMEHRAKASGAIVSVKSNPGEGTVVRLEMKIS